MQKPDHHIFVCASFRGTEAKGKCIKKDSMQLIPYMQEELADRGLNAMVSSTGCLNLCEEGPVMVIYPQGTWYRDVTSDEWFHSSRTRRRLQPRECGRSKNKAQESGRNALLFRPGRRLRIRATGGY
ncbi:ferredoxin [Thermodesulfobacteriota bacterium]